MAIVAELGGLQIDFEGELEKRPSSIFNDGAARGAVEDVDLCVVLDLDLRNAEALIRTARMTPIIEAVTPSSRQYHAPTTRVSRARCTTTQPASMLRHLGRHQQFFVSRAKRNAGRTFTAYSRERKIK